MRLGMDAGRDLATFYDTVTFRKDGDGWATPFFPERCAA